MSLNEINTLDFNLEPFLEFAVKAAKKAGKHTLRYFNKEIDVNYKSDNSPVTKADKESEQLIRSFIEANYPTHNIIGEEFGATHRSSDFTWILDPIDGTRSFIHAIPLYTTLIGLVYKNVPVVGVVYAPATDEIAEGASGLGARYNGSSCKVTEIENINEALFLTTDIRHFEKAGINSVHDYLVQEVKQHRTWGDAYGHMKVAAGQADIMFDPLLNIWDAAALLPLITEAGGMFTDINGNSTIKGGSGVSANKILSKKILDTIKQFR